VRLNKEADRTLSHSQAVFFCGKLDKHNRPIHILCEIII